MTVYFAGTSVADHTGAGSVATTNLASGVSEGVSLNSPALMIVPFNAVDQLWIAFTIYVPNGTNGNANGFCNILFGSTPLFRLRNTGSGTAILEYWNSSSWTQVGSSSSISNGTLNRMDIRLRIHDTLGELAWYHNGSLIASMTGDTLHTANTTVNSLQITEFGTSGADGTVSAWFGASFDTRGIQMVQRPATGNGAYTSWTGDYTDIDGNGIDDSAGITSMVPDDMETFTKANLAAYAGWDVHAVIHAMRVRQGISSFAEISTIVRYGSTDYESDPITPTTSLIPMISVMEVNPSTSDPWDISDLSTSEFGVKALAA